MVLAESQTLSLAFFFSFRGYPMGGRSLASCSSSAIAASSVGVFPELVFRNRKYHHRLFLYRNPVSPPIPTWNRICLSSSCGSMQSAPGNSPLKAKGKSSFSSSGSTMNRYPTSSNRRLNIMPIHPGTSLASPRYTTVLPRILGKTFLTRRSSFWCMNKVIDYLANSKAISEGGEMPDQVGHDGRGGR